MYRDKIIMKQYFSETYLLKDNPFSITPSTEDIVWADRSDLFSFIERKIETSISTSPSRIIVNWGEWGSGKTHAMIYFTSNVFRDNFRKKYKSSIDFLSLGIHLPRPVAIGTMGELLYYEIVNAVTFETLQSTLNKIREHLTKKRLTFSEVDTKIREHLKTMTGRSEFASFFSHLTSPLAKRFLFGEKLSIKELRTLGLTRNIESIGDILEMLSLMVKVLTKPFDVLPESYAEIFIWIDENEALREINPKDVFVYRSILRDLLDYASTDLTIFLNFSLTPGEDYSIVEAQLGNALLSRIDENIQLEPIKTQDDCMNYIEQLIQHVRTKKPPNGNVLHPFKRDAVEHIVSEGLEKGWLPRDLNKVLTKALEIGFAENKAVIDKAFINNNREQIFPKISGGSSPKHE